MDANLQQNIVHTIYALFIHNYIVFAYFFGFLLSILISVRKPSRFSVLLMLGFAVLTFSFEYDKHIIEGFREQTLQSFITDKPHFKVQEMINMAIGDILPVAFYLLGWFLIYLAIAIEGFRKKEKRVATKRQG